MRTEPEETNETCSFFFFFLHVRFADCENACLSESIRESGVGLFIFVFLLWGGACCASFFVCHVVVSISVSAGIVINYELGVRRKCKQEKGVFGWESHGKMRHTNGKKKKENDKRQVLKPNCRRSSSLRYEPVFVLHLPFFPFRPFS